MLQRFISAFFARGSIGRRIRGTIWFELLEKKVPRRLIGHYGARFEEQTAVRRYDRPIERCGQRNVGRV